MQLLPVAVSAFQQDVCLAVRFVFRGPFEPLLSFLQILPILYRSPSFFIWHKAERMPCLSVPSVHLSRRFVGRVYFSHKRNASKGLTPAAYMKICWMDGRKSSLKKKKKKKTSAQLFVVYLCFNFWSWKFFLVLFLYYQLIVCSFQ